MTDIPIIFSGPMVRALIDGRKTMTRRLLKPQPEQARDSDGKLLPHGIMHLEGEPRPRIVVGRVITKQELRYAAGDRLWVRETWCPVDDKQFGGEKWIDYRATPKYAASHPAGWHEEPDHPEALKWRSPIHCPRTASRLTLVVTATKIEYLQDISERDATAEGVEAVSMVDVKRQAAWSNRGDFAQLWNKLHGPGAWDANPEVVALTFTVYKQNIDAMPKAVAA